MKASIIILLMVAMYSPKQYIPGYLLSLELPLPEELNQPKELLLPGEKYNFVRTECQCYEECFSDCRFICIRGSCTATSPDGCLSRGFHAPHGSSTFEIPQANEKIHTFVKVGHMNMKFAAIVRNQCKSSQGKSPPQWTPITPDDYDIKSVCSLLINKNNLAHALLEFQWTQSYTIFESKRDKFSLIGYHVVLPKEQSLPLPNHSLWELPLPGELIQPKKLPLTGGKYRYFLTECRECSERSLTDCQCNCRSCICIADSPYGCLSEEIRQHGSTLIEIPQGSNTIHEFLMVKPKKYAAIVRNQCKSSQGKSPAQWTPITPYNYDFEKVCLGLKYTAKLGYDMLELNWSLIDTLAQTMTKVRRNAI